VNTNDPQELRDPAAELRAQAQAMEDGYSRAIMLVLASDCDQLADCAEERAKKMGIRHVVSPANRGYPREYRGVRFTIRVGIVSSRKPPNARCRGWL
jgi:hypothetical protein